MVCKYAKRLEGPQPGEQKNNHLIGSNLGFTQRGNRSSQWKALESVLVEARNNWARQSMLSLISNRDHGRLLSREMVGTEMVKFPMF